MKDLEPYLLTITDDQQRLRMRELFQWVEATFPNLTSEIKWHQPMFMDHGTFIIGFSIAKNHMAFTTEEVGIKVFSEAIKQAGYEHTKMIGRIKWTDEVNYALLKAMINYNIEDKKLCTTFFR